MATPELIATVYEEVKKDIILSLGWKYGACPEDVEDALHDVLYNLLNRIDYLTTWKAAQVEAALRHETRCRLLNMRVASIKRSARETRYAIREGV